MKDNNVQITLRLQSAVHRILTRKAEEKGQEPSEYIADELTRSMIDELGEEEKERLGAQMRLKEAVIDYARNETRDRVDPDIIRKTFRWIQDNDHPRDLYSTAIGGKPEERLNHIKAALNRALGRAIKYALKAESAEEVKNLRGELILSYHKLSF